MNLGNNTMTLDNTTTMQQQPGLAPHQVGPTGAFPGSPIVTVPATPLTMSQNPFMK